MKKVSIVVAATLILAMFVGANSFAQAPSIQWQKCLGGTKAEYVQKMIVTLDNGYIIVGGTNSNNGDISNFPFDTSSWSGAGFVLKIDSLGVKQWSKNFSDDSNYYRFYSVINTLDSGYLAVGYLISMDSATSAIRGDDILVMKLDKTGYVQWKKIIGGDGEELAFDVLQNNDSSYIITGQTTSNNGDFSGIHGGPTNMGMFPSDGYVLRLSKVGNIIWSKCYGGSWQDYLSSISKTFDNNYIISGGATSTDDDVIGNIDNSLWYLKIDTSGIILWSKCSPVIDYYYSGGIMNPWGKIITTLDSGYVFAKQISDTGNVGNDLFLISKRDKSGLVQWESMQRLHSLACFTGKELVSIFQNSDSSYIISGTTDSLDIFISKITKTGSLVWEKHFGGTESDMSISLVRKFDDTYIICGQTESNDGDVSGNHGGPDIWLVKIGPQIILATNEFQFTASLQKNIVQITWHSSGQSFEVQRSPDAQHWESIARTAALQFDDTKPLIGTSYYRLKVIEKDGSFTYSNITRILYHANDIKVFPTVTTGSCTISGLTPYTRITVYSSTGCLLFSRTTSDMRTNIDLSLCARGMYFIKVEDEVFKVIKK